MYSTISALISNLPYTLPALLSAPPYARSLPRLTGSWTPSTPRCRRDDYNRTVVGVCLMVLYVVCLDQASQGLVVWLGGKSPLAEFMPFKLLGEVVVAGGDETAIPGAFA